MRAAAATPAAVQPIMGERAYHVCTFCGGDRKQVGTLILASKACICRSCATFLVELHEASAESQPTPGDSGARPDEPVHICDRKGCTGERDHRLPSWCGNDNHSHRPHMNNGDCAPPPSPAASPPRRPPEELAREAVDKIIDAAMQLLDEGGIKDLRDPDFRASATESLATLLTADRRGAE